MFYVTRVDRVLVFEGYIPRRKFFFSILKAAINHFIKKYDYESTSITMHIFATINFGEYFYLFFLIFRDLLKK